MTYPINRLPSNPSRAHASLKIPPGFLNDFNVDDIDFESIDFQSESPESILNRIRDKVFTSNKFKTSGTLVGILMRVEKSYAENCTGLDITAGTTQSKKSKKYALNTYKIRVPELHFMLPVPNSLKSPDKQDHVIMDAYPTIQAADTWVNDQVKGGNEGDLVKVEISNKGAITRLYCVGPLDPTQSGLPNIDKKKCVDECVRKATAGGSKGDCIGYGTNLAKLNSGMPPVTKGGQIQPDGPTIVGDYKTPDTNWLANVVSELQLKGKKKEEDKVSTQYNGLVWLGPTGDNGSNDTLKMLKDSTTLPKQQNIGRQMLIYVPQGVDLKSHLEIIYWFHNSKDFVNNLTDNRLLWKGIAPSLHAMSKKVEGKMRNFVFVVPEMLWSREDSVDPYNHPRVQSQKTIASFQQRRYRDRHWGAWNFDTKVTNAASLMASKSPPGMVTAIADPAPSAKGNGGEMSKIHDKVLATLKDQGATFTVSPYITLVGDRYGAAAIGVLARQESGLIFGGEYPNKIQYFHADYSSTPQNGYCDSDLYEIITAIPETTQLEVHLGPEETEDYLPNRAAAAFFGMILSSQGASFSTAVNNLNASVKGFNFVGIDTNKAEDTILDSLKLDMTWKHLKEFYDTGLNLVQESKTTIRRMAKPWVNVVFKKWNKVEPLKWIKWLPTPGQAPTAFSVESAEDNLKKAQLAAAQKSKEDAEKKCTEAGGTFTELDDGGWSCKPKDGALTTHTAPGQITCALAVSYDKEGNAYDIKNIKMDDSCKLKNPKEPCPKGKVEDHTPSTPKLVAIKKKCEDEASRNCVVASGPAEEKPAADSTSRVVSAATDEDDDMGGSDSIASPGAPTPKTPEPKPKPQVLCPEGYSPHANGGCTNGFEIIPAL